MFIAVLSVKLKIKTYAQRHKIVMDYRYEIVQDSSREPISECQQRLFFKYFLNWSNDRAISADKMIRRAKEFIWHKKQKDKGIVQMHQLNAFKEKSSTWKQNEVLG